jgi:hypothetical protein
VRYRTDFVHMRMSYLDYKHGLLIVLAASRSRNLGRVMRDAGDRWNDNTEDLIRRIELRLEQYRIHAEGLERGARLREGVDELIRRLEERLVGLRAHRSQMVAINQALRKAAADRRDQGANSRGT